MTKLAGGVPLPKRDLIILAAGHDPWKTGAFCKGLDEHEIAVQICAYVMGYLGRYRRWLDSMLLRPVTLGQKIQLVNQERVLKPQYERIMAVEVHCNAGPPEVGGVEVFHKRIVPRMPRGKVDWVKQPAHAMAVKLSEEIAGPLRRNRGAKGEEQSQHKRLAWCSGTDVPAVLVEVGFLTGKVDRGELMESAGRERIAMRMAMGLARGMLAWAKEGSDV